MIYKRGKYWFMWNGELIRESTKQRNNRVAREMEAAHRISLARGEVGIREKKKVSNLAEFCRKRFAPWAESVCSLKTWRDFYRVGLLAIYGYAPIADLALDVKRTAVKRCDGDVFPERNIRAELQEVKWLV